ncbi:MAG: cytochrome c oxidase assembly protein [Myxococcota bacterium]|nr:cytochrome c oxidase assembly protein [Myxococcota bacterium]
MDATRALLSSWSFEPAVVIGLGAAAGFYLRGFAQLHHQLPGRFPAWRRTAFLGGLAAVAVALLSPLDGLSDLLLQAHMAQHWLLMGLAAPLLWLGAPVVPLLRGLPRAWLRRGLGPFLAWPALRRALRAITRPLPALAIWALVTLAWHWPAAYQAALRDPFWHQFEHACFLAAALLFWYPVIEPWPARRKTERPELLLYLAAAAVFNTVFSASFAFSDRVFYPLYALTPTPWSLSPLADQRAAGALMWVASVPPVLLAAVAVVVRLLGTTPRNRARGRRPLAAPRKTGNVLGRIAARTSSLGLRRAAQLALFALAAAIVLDGWFGPQHPSALNLAGVLPWTYWRGIAVIALLVAGNLVCAACPFTLTRSLAARLLGQPFAWPAALRNKWLPVVLFAIYLWAYETFALWDSPYWTAWIIVGYFSACFLVEGLFPRGTFCRHLCPIGQFQFINSGISPVEVRAQDAGVCSRCTTHDCLRGNADHPGCPTGLFLPTKAGNLDCTFCQDCVRACPHDNAGLAGLAAGVGLGNGRSRRAPARIDLAALSLLICFGAFANAGAMVQPVISAGENLATWLGTSAAGFIPGLVLLAAMTVLPALLAPTCAAAGRVLAGAHGRRPSTREIVARLSPALVPLGFSMWLAHFSFHLWTGLGTLAPASDRALTSLGLAAGRPFAATPPTGTLFPELELWLLGAGLVVSVAVGWRLARSLATGPGPALRLGLPWAALALVLYASGIWIVLQPMQMRGMVM